MGEDLTVQFDIDARENKGKWYNDFRAYNVIRGQAIPQSASTIAIPVGEDLPFMPPMSETADSFTQDDGSELPF